MEYVSPSASSQLLESFHGNQQQQQLHQNYNFPEWSTTDPTLLFTDRQQQQRPEFLFNGGLSSFPCAQPFHQSRSSNDLHQHAGVSAASFAEQINLHGEMITMSGGSTPHDNALSNGSSDTSIDPFSFCVAGGGGGVNASSQPQWMQQMCSLPSDQYYNCMDALVMPKLVSDPFADSHHQQQQPQQQQPCSYYTSSTSVNCLHEADSCGSSDRDRSTTSEETNWMNNSSSNNSDLSNLPHLRACGDGDSLTGLKSASVPIELPDEFSSSIVAAADDVQLATDPTTILDHVGHHHHPNTGGTGAIECGAAATPTGRVSWTSPGIGSVQKNNHVITTTLDPLLLLGSAAAASPIQQQLQISNGLLQAPRSGLGQPFKLQHRGYTLDSLPIRAQLPFSLSTSQNCSSSISPKYTSVYSMPSGLVDNCTTSGNSFYNDFHSISSRPQQHGVSATPSSVPGAGGVGVKEFNVGSGFESSRDYYKMTLLSSSRKPNATSIEPQSVAARHRRKKISERVRILEKLIPGGNKMDTASMLDEALEYVKFLQLQVHLLESMAEPEPFNMQSSASTAAEGLGRTLTTATTTSTTTTSTNSSAFQGSAFHGHNSCKVDSSALIGGGFGSSQHLSRSSALMLQVTIAAATSTQSTSSPPLILSEVLQEQLFKQKLCLVSLRQYCPQQQAR